MDLIELTSYRIDNIDSDHYLIFAHKNFIMKKQSTENICRHSMIMLRTSGVAAEYAQQTQSDGYA